MLRFPLLNENILSMMTKKGKKKVSTWKRHINSKDDKSTDKSNSTQPAGTYIQHFANDLFDVGGWEISITRERNKQVLTQIWFPIGFENMWTPRLNYLRVETPHPVGWGQWVHMHSLPGSQRLVVKDRTPSKHSFSPSATRRTTSGSYYLPSDATFEEDTTY